VNGGGKRIKLCGLTRDEDIIAVNVWKPDYAGFVFAPGKRQLTPEKAHHLREALLPEIQSVGVFVNSPIKDILTLIRNRTINIVQLHGDEDGEYINTLRSHMDLPVPIIKAIRVQSGNDMVLAESYPSDYLLFDTYCRDLYGGSGKTFDWSMIPAIKKPWFLAGGIGAGNIMEAAKTEAFCLDVSSSLETEGRKDPEKIKEIIQIIRSEL
jgi:phosphoribosylanthranilate isomerase